MFGVGVEGRLQAFGVEARDPVDDHRVEARGLVRIVVVRQIGARHQQRPAAPTHDAQRVPERIRRGRGLPPHDERHDR